MINLTEGKELNPAAYRQAVIESYARLKHIDSAEELSQAVIPLENVPGCLLPLCEANAEDPSVIAELARWREAAGFSYPTQFPVTLQGTATWIRKRVLEVEDRIVFFVCDGDGQHVGQIGFGFAANDCGEAEVENVVRGDRSAPPGIMSEAMRAMIGWARNTSNPHSVTLRVFSDNEHAVNFYRRLGFRDQNLEPLRRHTEGDTVAYRDLEADDHASADKFFLHMIYIDEAGSAS